MQTLETCANEQVRVNPDQTLLTDRQAEVLEWRANGKSLDMIAAILGITIRTAKFHVGESAQRLGAVNGYQVITLAILNGVLKPASAVAHEIVNTRNLTALLVGIALSITVLYSGAPRTSQARLRNPTNVTRLVRSGRKVEGFA